RGNTRPHAAPAGIHCTTKLVLPVPVRLPAAAPADTWNVPTGSVRRRRKREVAVPVPSVDALVVRTEPSGLVTRKVTAAPPRGLPPDVTCAVSPTRSPRRYAARSAETITPSPEATTYVADAVPMSVGSTPCTAWTWTG